VYTVRFWALVFGQGERANSRRPIPSPHPFKVTDVRRRRGGGGSPVRLALTALSEVEGRTAPTWAIGFQPHQAGERL